MIKIAGAALACALIVSASALPGGAAAERDGATILNSGSTNAYGFTLKVWSDGSAAESPARGATGAGMARRISVPPALAQRLLDDAKAAKTAQIAVEPCMKSASFGTRLTVTYHEWTSPDLTCPGGGPAAQALRNDVQAIQQAGGVTTMPVHRIRLPNEPRRVPNEPLVRPPEASPSAAPSATPEHESV